MCGIAGLVDCGDDSTLARMIRVQAHRGSDDDAGLWQQTSPDAYVGLGSRRLAILDLSESGHIPMSNEDDGASGARARLLLHPVRQRVDFGWLAGLVLCLPANFGRTADLIAAVGSSLVRSFI